MQSESDENKLFILSGDETRVPGESTCEKREEEYFKLVPA